MSIHRLNRKLVLETPFRQSDGAGGFTTDWQPVGELWAAVTARTGRETASAGAPVSAMSYRIVVRGVPFGAAHRPKPEQRLREGARLFLINAVADEGADGRYLICFATEEMAV